MAMFSEREYRTASELLPVTLHNILREVCDPLLTQLTDQHVQQKRAGNMLPQCQPCIDISRLVLFEEQVHANLANLTDPMRVDVLLRFVSGLFVLYGNPCLFNGERLVSFDQTVPRWGLHNNVILDANGRMDAQYAYDPSVVVDSLERIVDHRRWRLTQVDFNDTKLPGVCGKAAKCGCWRR